MRNISEALFKIAAIFLIAYGLSSFMGLTASMKMTPRPEHIEIPALAYWSTLIPVFIGAILWLSIPKLISTTVASAENFDSGSVVSVGCFLLGLFWVSSHLPNLIYFYFHFKKVSSVEYIGESLPPDQIASLLVMCSRLLIGLLLMSFSVKVGTLFMFLEKNKRI